MNFTNRVTRFAVLMTSYTDANSVKMITLWLPPEKCAKTKFPLFSRITLGPKGWGRAFYLTPQVYRSSAKSLHCVCKNM